MQYSEDVLVLVHMVHRKLVQWHDASKITKLLGWDTKRVKAAQRDSLSLIKTFGGGLNSVGLAAVKENPMLDHPALQSVVEQHEAALPLASIRKKREILAMLKEGKYAKPFEEGRFAFVSLIGTQDWQDYASLVLQMIEIDTLLNIEEKLDSVLNRLGEDQRTPRESNDVELDE